MATIGQVLLDSPSYPMGFVSKIGQTVFGNESSGDAGTTSTTYHMSGFDSTVGTRVYWESTDAPDLTPVTTSPALVGSLVYPHVIGIQVNVL